VRTESDDLGVIITDVTALSDLLCEKRRARRIARGLPADPPPIDYDQVRAEAAVLRAENDLREARAILAATRRGRA